MAEIGGAGGATVTYKFRPNPNTPKAIALSPKIEAALKVLVSRISERAKEIAPVITGEFRDSIGDDVIVDKGRWVGVVFAEAPYAA